VGRTLRLQADRPALVHWTADGWSTTHDTIAREIGLLGVWVADLETSALAPGTAVEFTLYYPSEQRWENVNYRVELMADKV
jgi:glucoamylase